MKKPAKPKAKKPKFQKQKLAITNSNVNGTNDAPKVEENKANEEKARVKKSPNLCLCKHPLDKVSHKIKGIDPTFNFDDVYLKIGRKDLHSKEMLELVALRRKGEDICLSSQSLAGEVLDESKVKVAPVLLEKKLPARSSTAQPPKHRTKPKSSTYGLSFNPSKIYYYGERGSGFTCKGPKQKYIRLRDHHLSHGTLFEDPEFACDETTFELKTGRDPIEWKRPSEIVDSPHFFVEGFSRFDIKQGKLGDCWLLAGMSLLTQHRELFNRVIPPGQSFNANYAGIFHFVFWQYGRWVDVPIDDRLPTRHGKLVLVRSTARDEFWSALMEKAYAKLRGSYMALEGGHIGTATEDFTGGMAEIFSLDPPPPNLWNILVKGEERNSFMGCSITPNPDIIEAPTSVGLICGHAYSITAVKQVHVKVLNIAGKMQLVRLRNPWGHSEWNGPWSDGSAEWKYISKDEKEMLGLVFERDGEFWMPFTEMVKHFSNLDICNLNPDTLDAQDLIDKRKRKWELAAFDGEWVRGVSAGGCRNFLDTFSFNPQYRVTLSEPDEGDEEGKCTVIVALMQRTRPNLNFIGFIIYHLEQPERLSVPLKKNFFKYTQSTAKSDFEGKRQVVQRLRLPPGTYCIIPSTYQPGNEGEFLLRVFSENKNVMQVNEPPVKYESLTLDSIADQPEELEQLQKACDVFVETSDTTNQIEWFQLQDILETVMGNSENNRSFSKDTLRTMFGMMDYNRNGTMDLQEFRLLFIYIKHWTKVFDSLDTSGRGTVGDFQLREALESVGYQVNTNMLNFLMHRYGNARREIEYNEFILAAIKLRSMIDLFKSRRDENGQAHFSLEDWLEITLYT